MQKNCKKMQIYLHISKKSSIFATDFNGGVHNNQNETRVMEKECVFRCQFNGKMYRVLMCKHENREGMNVYWVYKGRRKKDKWPWMSLAGAVGSIMCEMGTEFMDKYKSIWA